MLHTQLLRNLSTLKQSTLIKISITSLSILMIAGCSSLGSGSMEKRATKLATGIQKAYAIDSSTANRIAPMIVQSADQHQVDPLLIAALIRQESNYRNYAISSGGAVGLTQVIPSYWKQSCSGDLLQEASNINCGTYILAKYNQSAGSWEKALAYYNVGPTGYESSWKMKRRGKKYAKQVKQHEHNLKGVL